MGTCVLVFHTETSNNRQLFNNHKKVSIMKQEKQIDLLVGVITESLSVSINHLQTVAKGVGNVDASVLCKSIETIVEGLEVVNASMNTLNVACDSDLTKETALKNQAYNFILSSGLDSECREFRKKWPARLFRGIKYEI